MNCGSGFESAEPFGPESFDPELMTEGLTAEGLVAGWLLARNEKQEASDPT